MKPSTVDISSLSSKLRKAGDGIWYAPDVQIVSYPSEGNDNCFAVESTSWWFKHRNDCIVSLVEAFLPPSRGCIFDIGGGNGFVAQGLAEAGIEVALVEPGLAGARNAKARGIDNVVCATIDTAGFAPDSLPAVGLFDVIEHIEDDVGFLQGICGILRNDGRLYATVPAYQWLWSDEDIKAGHYRRYTRERICEVLLKAGFEVEFSTYFFRFLPLPILLLRALPHRLGLTRKLAPEDAAGKDHDSGASSGAIDSLLRPELKKIRARKSMAFGGSCLLVAKPLKAAIDN